MKKITIALIMVISLIDNGGECYPERYNNRAFGTEY